MKYITANDAEKIMNSANMAVANISHHKCRILTNTRESEKIRLLNGCKSRTAAPMSRCSEVLYVVTRNHGNKRWPDYYKSVESYDVTGDVFRETEHSLIFVSKHGFRTMIRKNAVLAIVKK